MELEGLCNSDYFSRNGVGDHWKGEYTRGSPKGRSIVSWNHVSPSQIENFIKCKRLWHFKSILKIPEKQKGHQSLGEAFHLVLEKVPQGLSWPSHADVDATQDDWDKAEAMAKQALPLLPTSDRIKREQGIRLDTYPGGPTMVGYIDLGIPTGVGWPAFLIPTSEAIVGDYKTLSDFRYMKTPQELADSVQMMTYAKWAIEPYPLGLHKENEPTPESVRLLHLYARTKPPFTRSSIRYESAIVTPSEINSRWNKTLDIVREMQQVSSCTDANEVEAGGALNGHCEAYGGCHFRDKCGIAKSNGIKSIFQITKKPVSAPQEQNLMGSPILDKIRAAQAKAASATQATPATVAPSATISASPGTVENPAALNSTMDESKDVVNSSNQQASALQTVKGPVSGLLAKIQSTGKGRPHLAGAIAQAYGKEQGQPLVTLLGDGDLRNTTVSTLGELVKLASGVVPPDAPARTQEVITRPGEVVQDPELEEEGEDSESNESESDTTGNTSTGDPSSLANGASTGAALPVEGQKKRGRPSREEMALREVAQRKAFEDAVAAEVAKRTNSTGNHPVTGESAEKLMGDVSNLERELFAAKKDRDYYKNLADVTTKAIPHLAQAQEGLTLYIDCFPTKGDVPIDFFEWIGPICAQVAQANSVGDWRQINYTGKGLLANAIRETVKEHGTPKALTVSTFAGGADIALEILIPIAKRVIKKL